MRAFVLLACVAMAYGRPEPPVGYSYSAPSTRYSAASLGGGHSSGGAISGLSFGGGHSSGGLSGGGLSFGGGHSSGGLSEGGISFGGSSGGFGGAGAGGLSLGGDSGFGGGFSGGFSGAPLVQKHIYVHVPPPEPEQQRIPNIPAIAPPQKHYKIIFIKAPAPPAPAVPIIPVQPQNEEKTLVYVLVKKPEEQPDIVIPTAAPTQPSKPEVYFIKYQTQTEGGIGGGSIGGGSIGGGSIGGGSIGDGSIGGGDELGAIALGGGSGIGGGIGSGGHGGAEISGDFGTSGGDESAGSGHGGATSSQYGPPGHVAGPLH